MIEIAHERLVGHVRSAMSHVFQTMLGVEAKAQDARVEDSEPPSFDGVMALVGIAGAWTGTGRLLLTPSLACTLAGNLLMSTFERVDEEVLDAIAEIGNMVVGNFKNMLEEELGPLCLSVPTVIFGKNYKTRSAGMQDWLVAPFRCQGETIEFRFCLSSNPAHNGRGGSVSGTRLDAAASCALTPAPENPRAGYRLEFNHVI
jgi:chemotaxis protein CheX